MPHGMFRLPEGIQSLRESGESDMRIVVAVVVVTFFVLYEQIYNDWDITQATIKEVSRLWNMTGF